MKALVFAALAILALSISATTIGYLTEGDGAGTTATPSAPTRAPATAPTIATEPTTTTAPSTGATTVEPTTTAVGFTAAETAQHNTSDSCWLLISGRVYDVTSYLRDHPGGARTITPWCGKESTEAFATADGRGEHSAAAYAHLGLLDLGPALP